jgi:hypothetical protein
MVKKNEKNLGGKILTGVLAVGFIGATVIAGANILKVDDQAVVINDLESSLEFTVTQLNDSTVVISDLQEQIVNLEEQDPVIEYVNNTVEVVVEVDNQDLKFVLERLEDKMIITDASDIVAELKAEDEAISGAFDFVDVERDELFDMLEEAGIVIDEDDVRVIKVYNDYEDVTIVSADFDEQEYEVILKYKIEDLKDEVKKYVEVTVLLEDGEYSFVEVQEI